MRTLKAIRDRSDCIWIVGFTTAAWTGLIGSLIGKF